MGNNSSIDNKGQAKIRPIYHIPHSNRWTSELSSPNAVKMSDVNPKYKCKDQSLPYVRRTSKSIDSNIVITDEISDLQVKIHSDGLITVTGSKFRVHSPDWAEAQMIANGRGQITVNKY